MDRLAVSRPTADIVYALRTGGVLDLRTHGATLHKSTIREAADRLEELESALTAFRDDHENYLADRAAIDALRPPCPTCGGRATLINADPATHPGDGQLHYIPCPDCPDDGKVSIEQLAATWRAVHSDAILMWNASSGTHPFHYLRAVKP